MIFDLIIVFVHNSFLFTLPCAAPMDLESLIQSLTKFYVSHDDNFIFQGLKTLKLFTDVKSHVVLLVDHFEILARFI